MKRISEYTIVLLGWFVMFVFILPRIWSIIIGNPLNPSMWLAENLPDRFYLLMGIHDLAMNFVLIFPIGYLISRSVPNYWIPVAVAVTTIFCWEYRMVIFPPDDFLAFIAHPVAFQGMLSALLILPMTLCISSWARRRLT